MPHERIRYSRRGSCDPSTEFALRVGLEQNHPAVRLHGSEAEDFGHERADLTRREIRDCHDGPTDEIPRSVPRLDRGGRLPHTMGAKIDLEPVRRIPRLGKVLRSNDPTDAHLDFLELLERNMGHDLVPSERPRSILPFPVRREVEY